MFLLTYFSHPLFEFSALAAHFYASVSLPLLGGLVLSFGLEGLLKPFAPALRRPWRSLCVHISLWTLLFCIFLALTQRPWFSTVLTIAIHLLIVLVSNAKYRALREPFVFADFEFFSDSLKHPRLFLPYFGIWRVVAGCVFFNTSLYLGLTLEPGIPKTSGWGIFLVGLATMVAAAIVLLCAATPRQHPSRFDPAADIRAHGLLPTLWSYALAARTMHDLPGNFPYIAATGSRKSQALPNIVIVQSESFFDARRLHPEVHPALLQHFDSIRAASAQYGHLHVPAWGGNTARSEFSFLTGLRREALGVHRFNPHRTLSPRGIPSIASYLKGLGYRTVCIHPYPVQFYSRHEAYPSLGFDRFIDIELFHDAKRYGPYISDQAVSEKICALLGESDVPTLVFAITMENHGPLHLERVAAGDHERLYSSRPPQGYDDLTIYLRHLQNADLMIRDLRQHLAQSKTESCLCWYGDHVPILSSIYDTKAFGDGRTDYFIWKKGLDSAAANFKDIEIADLGITLLEHAGLRPVHSN